MKRTARRVLPIAVAVAVVAGLFLATRPWSGDEAANQAAASPAEYGICNVSVSNIPEGVSVVPLPVPEKGAEPTGQRLYMVLYVPRPHEQRTTSTGPGQVMAVESRVAFDAMTGEKAFEHYRTPQEEAQLKSMLPEVRSGPWVPQQPAWPRTDTPPQGEVVALPDHPRNAGLEYRQPDRASGLFAGAVGGDSFDYLKAYTCESLVEVDAGTGTVVTYSVVPGEEAMFQRFLDEVVAP
jgi:hypothetical protein